MAATLLNEMGEWHPDAIERQLAHVDTNQVRRAYARGEYWDERVQMMQRWSDYLDELGDGRQVIRADFKAARSNIKRALRMLSSARQPNNLFALPDFYPGGLFLTAHDDLQYRGPHARKVEPSARVTLGFGVTLGCLRYRSIWLTSRPAPRAALVVSAA